MNKMNCWEYFQCGRTPVNNTDGIVCPSTVESRLHSVNDGINAGRACWAVAGTMTGGMKCCKNAKTLVCIDCEFFKKVREEEGKNYQSTKDILTILRG